QIRSQANTRLGRLETNRASSEAIPAIQFAAWATTPEAGVRGPHANADRAGVRKIDGAGDDPKT
ncbi:MAG: hypothetical protein VX930_03850, partial [Pseudomonadota bacterium]|nr:hypothetical protein [Pseudomonadota bacterium]